MAQRHSMPLDSDAYDYVERFVMDSVQAKRKDGDDDATKLGYIDVEGGVELAVEFRLGKRKNKKILHLLP